MKTLMLMLFVLPMGAEAQTPTTDKTQERDVWVHPTPAIVLDSLRDFGKTYDEQTSYAYNKARAILRQEYGSYSEADREAIVAELERIIREGTKKQVRRRARWVLVDAATENGEGIPYPKAAESLIRQYEALEDKTGSEAWSVVYALIRAREDYVRAVFEAAEPPSEPCEFYYGRLWSLPEGESPPDIPEERRCPYKTEFCVVGELLIIVTEADVPDPENFLNICYGPTHSYENGTVDIRVF